jgi:hypothetical protein
VSYAQTLYAMGDLIGEDLIRLFGNDVYPARLQGISRRCCLGRFRQASRDRILHDHLCCRRSNRACQVFSNWLHISRSCLASIRSLVCLGAPDRHLQSFALSFPM